MRIPSKKIRDKFRSLMWKDIQKAVNLLCSYYDMPKIKLIFDGRKIGGDYGMFDSDIPSITLNGSHLTDRAVLHEFFHYVVWYKELDLSEKEEEFGAREFAREFLRA